MGKSGVGLKKHPTIAPCGLDCGLCPRFYTVGPSRCPGCAGPDFFTKHPSCSFITCCVKEKNLEVCAECPTFPCSKFKTEKEYQRMKDSPSYPPLRKVMPNLTFIKKHGLEKFLERQNVRMTFLRTMIDKYDDGRSKGYYCRVSALLDPRRLKSSIEMAALKVKAEHIKQSDVKARAKILRAVLDEHMSGLHTN
jgi:hypothetical protein